MIYFLSSLSQAKRTLILSVIGIVVAVAISIFTFIDPVIPILTVVVAIFVLYIIVIFKSPEIGLAVLITYCFLFGILNREVGSLPFGTGIEVILLTVWLAVLILNKKYDWKILNNSLVILMLFWLGFSILEIANPAGASPMGWLQEVRSTALFPVLTIPLVFLLFNSEKKMNKVLIFMIALSLLASFNGIKQLRIGLSPGEQRFLDEGGALTHLIWGKLRVFSFYSDAGQFGASMASFVLIAIVMAVGPFKLWKKILLAIAALFFIYGMLISGTRGALFALIVGAFFAIFLTKNIKILVGGGTVLLLFIVFLKYTYIGNSSYEIMRLRTALDPQEASLNVRFMNQKIIAEYLKSHPFGGGLGVIGNWGKVYNPDKFLSTIEPDSYWVKIWAMYGVVGFTMWFSMIMYILGKCCGIIWNIRNERLRYKNIAMLSATAGIFFCSYGNEVMNSMPSALVACLCFSFIYLSPGFDTKDPSLLEKEADSNHTKETDHAI